MYRSSLYHDAIYGPFCAEDHAQKAMKNSKIEYLYSIILLGGGNGWHLIHPSCTASGAFMLVCF